MVVPCANATTVFHIRLASLTIRCCWDMCRLAVVLALAETREAVASKMVLTRRSGSSNYEGVHESDGEAEVDSALIGRLCRISLGRLLVN